MPSDRKRMRKVREKRIKAMKYQIQEHQHKIKTEGGRKDTTKDYWRKEIDKKFLKTMKKDEEYLKEDK